MKTSRICCRITLAFACGATLTGFSGATVVLNQIGQANAYALAVQPTISQIFTDWPGYECMAIDDFTVGQSELRITNVSALIQAESGFAAFQDVAGYQLSIFSAADAAGTNLSGDVGNLFIISGSEASLTQINADHGLVSFNVNITLPAAGTYWVGVSPVAAVYLAGKFALEYNGAQGPVTPGNGNGNGKFANPGGGFGVGPLDALNVDYAYSVTAVPEPAAVTLWILGGLVGLRRHRGRYRAG